MILHKMGKDGRSRQEYAKAIKQYEERDTLSYADIYNCAFALGLSGEKEKPCR